MTKTILFPKSDEHTYKVVATRTSGRQVTYNYITEVSVVDELYVLEGRIQPDDGGTMEKRSFTLLSKAHPELDVRQISSTRQMQNQGQTKGQMATAGGDDEIPF